MKYSIKIFARIRPTKKSIGVGRRWGLMSALSYYRTDLRDWSRRGHTHPDLHSPSFRLRWLREQQERGLQFQVFECYNYDCACSFYITGSLKCLVMK